MKKTQYLEQQKNGAWYLRFKLNEELSGFYSKKLIKTSLKTKVLSEAITKRDEAIPKIENKTYGIKVKTSGDLLPEFIERYFNISRCRAC